MRKILLIMVTVFMTAALVACGGKKIEGFKYEDIQAFEFKILQRQEGLDSFIDMKDEEVNDLNAYRFMTPLSYILYENPDLGKVKIDGKTLQKHIDKLAPTEGKTYEEWIEDLIVLKNITLKFLKLEYNATLMENQDFADELGLVPYDVE